MDKTHFEGSKERCDKSQIDARNGYADNDQPAEREGGETQNHECLPEMEVDDKLAVDKEPEQSFVKDHEKVAQAHTQSVSTRSDHPQNPAELGSIRNDSSTQIKGGKDESDESPGKME